jgi:hypothetical protein
MRKFLILTFVAITYSSVPALAQNNGAATDDDVMHALHGGSGAAPAPAPAATEPMPPAEQQTQDSGNKAPISDLRGQQIEDDSETSARQQLAPSDEEADDPANCTAKDLASALKPPSDGQLYGKMADLPPQSYTLAGSEQANAERMKAVMACKTSYEKMTDACDLNASCKGCDAAVKKYTEDCAYVRRKDPAEFGGGGPGINMLNQQPLTAIPYTPGRTKTPGE